MSDARRTGSGKSGARSSPAEVHKAVSAPSRAPGGGSDRKAPKTPPAAKPSKQSGAAPARSSRRSATVRLLLVGFVVLAGLGVALASGALRAAKLKPPPAASVPVLGKAVNGTFTGRGVTFQYPKTWRTVPLAMAPAQAGTPAGRIVIGPGSGPDRVIVEAFRLETPISDAVTTSVMAQVSSDVAAFATAQHGRVVTPVATGTLGALPAFTATATWPGSGGAPMEGRFYFGYQGRAIYYVNCQISSTAPKEISEGCDQIVKTFAVA